MLLKLDDLGRNVGRVSLAATHSFQSGGDVGDEKEANKSDVQLSCGIADRDTLRLSVKHRIDHGGMTLIEDRRSALHEDFVNLLGNLRSIGALGQRFGFAAPEQLFSQDVTA